MERYAQGGIQGFKSDLSPAQNAKKKDNNAVADLRGGGFRGFKPPLGLPKKKKLMCIEKRHHNMSRPTQYVPIALCLRLSLRQ